MGDSADKPEFFPKVSSFEPSLLFVMEQVEAAVTTRIDEVNARLQELVDKSGGAMTLEWYGDGVAQNSWRDGFVIIVDAKQMPRGEQKASISGRISEGRMPQVTSRLIQGEPLGQRRLYVALLHYFQAAGFEYLGYFEDQKEPRNSFMAMRLACIDHFFIVLRIFYQEPVAS